MTALPMIDGATLEAPPTVAAISAACTGIGFFYLHNHGVPDTVMTAALRECRRFFARPLAARQAVSLRNSPCNRGYEAMGAQRLEAGAPPDLKEGFYIGDDLADDHPHVRAGYFNQGPNQWPDGMPEFRDAMTEYYVALTAVSTRLMTAMARSLALPADFFAGLCTQPMSVLRLLHYPPQPANPQPGEKGCGAHTDWGCVTLLWQDAAGGLQVRVNETWVAAPPIPGTFVVNIGDMFARWTNDRYRSTLHRVVNLSGTDRYSMPFFFEGHPGHEIKCLPGCVDIGEAPLYAPTTVSGHLAEMYAKTYLA